MTSSDDLIRQARQGVQPLAAIPSQHRAVVTCMDTRIDPLRVLGLRLGDAHILRNAGGVVTGDVVRSLIVSQRALQTRRIDVMMHTGCGMIGLDEDGLRRTIEAETGSRLAKSLGGFADLEAELRRGVEVLRQTRALADTAHVRGHILDIDRGRTRLVVS